MVRSPAGCRGVVVGRGAVSATAIYRRAVLGRRTIRVALACAIALIATTGASPALAWSNGLDGPNAYGTHDWILDHALSAFGDRADWVSGRAALRATDDPDTEDGIDHASGT
jgi:hypothetical protein